MSKYLQAEMLLLAIEKELRRLQVWEAEAPPAEALASTAPFCCDTLDFTQWLQFILLPRMRQLIEVRAPLPSEISMCPMAEESLKGSSTDYRLLIDLIADFDELLSGKRVQEQPTSRTQH